MCLKGKISFDAVKKEHIHDPMTLMWVIRTRSINIKKFSTCLNIYDFVVHVHITHAPEQLFAFGLNTVYEIIALYAKAALTR